MIKNNLLEQDYHFQDKEPKESIIAVIWAFFAIIFTAGIAVFFFLNYNQFQVAVITEELTAVMVVAVPFVYLFLKFLTTLLFCRDKNNIKFKLLESKYMPVCFCREAFRAWQVILIYLIPLVITHAGIFITGILLSGSPNFVILLFIMEFFMGLDFALVIYIIYIKIKYNPDYIAVNHHVYNLTLYSRTYVKIKKRKV